MKKILWSTLVNIAFVALFFTKSYSFQVSQDIAFLKVGEKIKAKKEAQILQITDGHFLVVGSFSFLKNAQSYSRVLQEKMKNPQLGFYSATNFYYVFLSESPDVSKVRKERDKLRIEEEFSEAWILSVDKSNTVTSKSMLAQTQEKHDGTAKAAETSKSFASLHQPIETNTPANQNVIELPSAKGAGGGTTATSDKKAFEEKSAFTEYKLYMNVVAGTTFKEIPASIKMIHGEQNKLAGLLDAHKTQIVRIPKGGVDQVQLICEAFGYKKIEQDLNIREPLTEETKNYVQVSNDTIIVNFELVRLKKGDIFTMFNVFFYTDAAVMMPKSIYELSSLLQMAKENENLKIRLHGHTNGNSFGKIIKLDKEQGDFFTVTPNNKHTVGSAKELSFERASTIKRYLVEQGVSEDRIEVKGWGGKKNIYKSDSPDAKKNVRVEVEIIKE